MDDQIFDNQTRSQMPVEFNQQPLTPEPRWKTFFREHKTIILSVTGVLLIGAVFAVVLMQNGGTTPPSSTNVILQIKGPEQITSGNEAEYTVTYRNGENADMVNVSLELLYPSGFKFKSSTPSSTASSGRFFNLPMVKNGDNASVIFRGILSGNTGESKEIKARLHYSLSNFKSQFILEQSVNTAILPPDLTMDVTGPVDVVNGQETTFTVNVTNLTAQGFDNLAIQLNYPPDFVFSSANFPPSRNNNYWKLANLPSNSSTSLEITGTFMGSTGEEQLVRADLGQVINNNLAPQISSTATFRLIPSALSLELTSQQVDFVKLGEVIHYKLEYANQGNIGLSNLTITAKLDGVALDMARLNTQNAIVTGNTLTWKAASLSNLSVLSPNERGEINFSVPVKATSTSNLKNQTINASAEITSQEITKSTKAAPINLKLISEMTLDVSGEYVSGAAPMKVGQSTTFNITMMLSNLSNDLTNAEVTAAMPLPASAWKNIIIPPSEASRLTYDTNSGRIRWNIGNLPAFTGKFSPVLRVTFQLEVTPSLSDTGRVITFLRDVQAKGMDSFVNQPIETRIINAVDSTSIQDDVLSNRGSTVQE